MIRVTAGGPERYCPACERSFATGDVCPQDGTALILLSAGPDQLIGSTLDGRYTIVEKLGAGGMGTVYRGLQLSVDREVAIKVVSPNLLAHSEVIKRFLREAKLASRLNHPNAVAVLDFGRAAGDLFFLVMERLVGRTLEDLIAVERRLPVDRALAIARQICDALVGAHQLSIVHRDLKPSNIMIVGGPGGRESVKVLDFGLAKLVSTEVSAQVTRTGIMLGTPAYMSPELAAGRDADARADLYALGCILYEMLSGRVPFAGKTLHETLAMHASEPPRPIADLPPWLMAAVSTLLAKDPADRYLTAEATLAALSAAGPGLERAHDRITSLEIPARPPGDSRLPMTMVETGPTLLGPTADAAVAQSTPVIYPPRARGRGRAIVVALALVALAAVGLLSWQMRGGRTAEESPPTTSAPVAPSVVAPAVAEPPSVTSSLASAADASVPAADAGAAESERTTRSRRDRRHQSKPRRERGAGKPNEDRSDSDARKGGLPF